MIELIVFLLVAGLLLMLIEIFLVPGLGVAGILGFLMSMAAVYLIGRDHGALMAIAAFLASMAIVVGCFFAFLRSPASRAFIHKGNIAEKSHSNMERYSGARGVSVTRLSPTGKACFVLDGKESVLEVSSEGEFIDPERDIEVSKVEGHRIFVRIKGA